MVPRMLLDTSIRTIGIHGIGHTLPWIHHLELLAPLDDDISFSYLPLAEYAAYDDMIRFALCIIFIGVVLFFLYRDASNNH